MFQSVFVSCVVCNDADRLHLFDNVGTTHPAKRDDMYAHTYGWLLICKHLKFKILTEFQKITLFLYFLADKPKNMYYVTINNQKYDRALLDVADSLVEGQGDGRISKLELQMLFEKTGDANKVTDIEKNTLKYIIDHYNCTANAIIYYNQFLKTLKID